MKAAVLEKVGMSPQFKIKELARPELKKGQVLVRNYASSINPVDLIMRQCKAFLATAGFTHQVIGCDFCGRVIHSRSTLFREGDEVFGMLPVLKGGAYAEELAVDASQIALKPENLSFVESATIPLVGLTAYQALFKVGKLKAESQVLITGCTGGVGAMAVQLANNIDCLVSGLCREEHRGFAKEIGCDVVIDYRRQEIPSGAHYDLIFDAAGKYTYSDLKQHLAEEGVFVTTRGETGHVKGLVKTAVDVVFEPKMKFVFVKPDRNDLNALKREVERGAIKPHVADTFSLAQICEAQDRMKEGGFMGKIGLDIS